MEFFLSNQTRNRVFTNRGSETALFRNRGEVEVLSNYELQAKTLLLVIIFGFGFVGFVFFKISCWFEAKPAASPIKK